MTAVRDLRKGEEKPDMARWAILYRHKGNKQVTAMTVYAETMLDAIEHCGLPDGSIFGACMWEHMENIGGLLAQAKLNISLHESVQH